MKNYVKWAMIIFVVSIAGGAVGFAERSAPPGVAPAGEQDIMSIDRRVSTLEQRMYSIDSNISQLQQQLTMMNRTSAAPSVASGEVPQLRLELDLLRSRITQIECAIAKLDERTLAPAKPKARTGVKDPCRLDAQTPIEMAGHPY